MIRTLADVEEYLAALPPVQHSYGQRLAQVRAALMEIGSPQDSVPAIHVAGTSGKGSTCYYAAALLRAAGYRVGLTVSPHVNKVSERAQIDGAPLPDADYCRYFSEFVEIVERHGWRLSYVELLDSYAYWLFVKLGVDYIVVEVGVGGRLDPTNVMTRADKTCVITDIGYDHMELLGDTLPQIAGEKAGIIHDGNDVLMHVQPAEVTDVIRQAAKQHAAALTIVANDTVLGSSLPRYQQRNWTLAQAAVTARLARDSQPKLTDEALEVSQTVAIPGRFERLTADGVPVILDAAHNPQKLTALCDSLAEIAAGTPLVFVVAFKQKKRAALADDMAVIDKSAVHVIATRLTTSAEHSLPPDETIAVCNTEATVVDNPYEALQTAVELARQRGAIVVVTGSFYLIDGLRLKLLG